MAEADCPTCEAMGYRSCDHCGGPTFGREPKVEGKDSVCTYCWNELYRPAGAPLL